MNLIGKLNEFSDAIENLGNDSCLDAAERVGRASYDSWETIYLQTLFGESASKDELARYIRYSKEALKKLKPMRGVEHIGHITPYIEKRIYWERSLAKGLKKNGLEYVGSMIRKKLKRLRQQNA